MFEGLGNGILLLGTRGIKKGYSLLNTGKFET